VNLLEAARYDRASAEQKWPRGLVEARPANLAPYLIGIEACVGAHHLSCKSPRLGHNPGLIPVKSVRRRTKLPVFVNSRENARY
jgi:hypothetical protein